MSYKVGPGSAGDEWGLAADGANARAGLLTPPGMTRLARTKASWLAGRRKSGLDRAGVFIVGAFGPSNRASARRRTLPSRRIAR